MCVWYNQKSKKAGYTLGIWKYEMNNEIGPDERDWAENGDFLNGEIENWNFEYYWKR